MVLLPGTTVRPSPMMNVPPASRDGETSDCPVVITAAAAAVPTDVTLLPEKT